MVSEAPFRARLRRRASGHTAGTRANRAARGTWTVLAIVAAVDNRLSGPTDLTVASLTRDLVD
jgi:hypothetical protein